MSDIHPELNDTQEIEVLTPEALASASASRIALCIAACQGVDDAFLKLLASTDESGGTRMQRLLSHITIDALPAIRE